MNKSHHPLLLTPPVVNAHTHIGDAFITLRHKYNLQELVGPGGLKHKWLQKAPPAQLLEGMKTALREMKTSQTTHFCDFREGGLQGVKYLQEATRDEITPIIFSRPKYLYYDKEEVTALLKISDGIGVSSISDWDPHELLKLAKHTEKQNKFFALHASERIPEPIDDILDLHPTYLIHMIHATPSDLEIVADHKLPIVVCPRSNAYFGTLPNISAMKTAGIDLMLGTDNAMITPPNILEEAQYLLQNFDITPEEVHNMISTHPRKYLNVI